MSFNEVEKDSTIELLVKCKQDVFFFASLLGLALNELQKESITDFLAQGDWTQDDYDTSGLETTLSAFLALYSALTNSYSKSVVMCPTLHQAKNVWLAEAERLVKGAYVKVSPWFRFYSNGFGVLGNKPYMWGLTIKAPKIESIQGICSDGLFLFLDGAQSIGQDVIEYALVATSSEKNRVLLTYTA